MSGYARTKALDPVRGSRERANLLRARAIPKLHGVGVDWTAQKRWSIENTIP